MQSFVPFALPFPPHLPAAPRPSKGSGVSGGCPKHVCLEDQSEITPSYFRDAGVIFTDILASTAHRGLSPLSPHASGLRSHLDHHQIVDKCVKAERWKIQLLTDTVLNLTHFLSGKTQNPLGLARLEQKFRAPRDVAVLVDPSLSKEVYACFWP